MAHVPDRIRRHLTEAERDLDRLAKGDTYCYNRRRSL